MEELTPHMEELTPSSQEINNKDRHFKGQQKTEEVICFCRKHWIVLMRHLAEFAILNTIIFSVLFYIKDNNITISNPGYKIFILVALAVALYFFHRFFVEMLNYYLTIVIITNYRVIELKKTIILHDYKGIIDLHEIQDIQKIQNGFLKNILDYGTIKIALAGLQDTRILEYIPKPDRYFRRINKAKRDYILKRRYEKRAELDRTYGEQREQSQTTYTTSPEAQNEFLEQRENIS